MKIKQIMNIPANFFFKTLVDPVIYDLKRYKGRDYQVSELQGLSYIRKTADNQDNKITIIKVVPNQKYSFMSQVGGLRTAISYQLKTIDPKHFELTYSETTASTSVFERTKHRIKQVVADTLKKQSLRKVWTQIEQSY
ncbi:DUF3284 domain-containing protein [Agrilactobacillus fermenti]|uniref:DUF3284 domain-containing protein n=1 Tax=Agrilactobacillus fermenti TaxID=2586909 RepID=UPI001E5FFD6E|nr:DUF3284 domain-containing protein [Agrilactobacillus fermenti]MCD2255163.1 DUF3284 domain-containing protein [Agrilactobacillus fermenti]